MESIRRVSARTTAHERGEKDALKGRTFNPYSRVSQNQNHIDWEFGWQSKQIPGYVESEKVSSVPNWIVLGLGVLLVVIIWYMNK